MLAWLSPQLLSILARDDRDDDDGYDDGDDDGDASDDGDDRVQGLARVSVWRRRA